METVRDFKFWTSKITADGDYSHDSKRRLLLGRKGMTNLGSILKSRNITLLTKVRLVKAMVFPIVMYGCESWTIKKAEHHTTDAFELWCCRRLLGIPWTARRSNKSILKISTHRPAHTHTQRSAYPHTRARTHRPACPHKSIGFPFSQTRCCENTSHFLLLAAHSHPTPSVSHLPSRKITERC